MKLYTVYKHVSPKGKVYIGITHKYPAEKRWGKNGIRYLGKNKNGEFIHRSFANAILKYGWNKIEHIILAEGLLKEEAEAIEISLIAYYKSKNMSYNITNGGEGASGSKGKKGIPMSEETKRKISLANKGRKSSPEFCAKMREIKSHISDETRKRMSAGQKGRIMSPETRLKMSLVAKGKPKSIEIRRKLSLSKIGNTIRKGKITSPETREKQRIAALKRVQRMKLEKYGIPEDSDCI